MLVLLGLMRTTSSGAKEVILSILPIGYFHEQTAMMTAFLAAIIWNQNLRPWYTAKYWLLYPQRLSGFVCYTDTRFIYVIRFSGTSLRHRLRQRSQVRLWFAGRHRYTTWRLPFLIIFLWVGYLYWFWLTKTIFGKSSIKSRYYLEHASCY